MPRRLIRSLTVIMAGLLAACEKPFEPIQQSDYVFSIYGHLEATADTQWVRVTSIRTALESYPEPIDAVVTLEEIETGTTVVMNDFLVHYRSVNLDGDVYAHNFSTTMPMVPGWYYRLTVTRSDGASATATVLIPTFDDPTLEVTSFTHRLTPARGVVHGTRYIGMLLGHEDILQPCMVSWTIHQEWLPIFHHAESDGTPHLVGLEWGARPPWVPLPPPCRLGEKRILVVASGEPWAYGWQTGLRESTHPSQVDNIQGNGLGFLAGVHTHVFPFEKCVPFPSVDRCTITFSQRSATLVGFVTDRCDGRPVGASVALHGPPSGGLRNATTSDGPGRFRVHGLDPGVPYTAFVDAGVDYVVYESQPLTFAEAAVDSVTFSVVDKRYELACPA